MTQGGGDLRQRVGGGDPGRVAHQRPGPARPQPEARRGQRDGHRHPRVGDGHVHGRPAGRAGGVARLGHHDLDLPSRQRADGQADRAGRGGRLPALHDVRLRDPRTMPGRAVGAETWRSARSAPAPLLPRRPGRGAAQGQAVGRPLPDRLADPEAADHQRPDLRGGLPLPPVGQRGGLVQGVHARDPRHRAGGIPLGAAGPPGRQLRRVHRRGLLPGRSRAGRRGPVDEVHVFADYLAEGKTAASNARANLELPGTSANGLYHRRRPTRRGSPGPRSARRCWPNTSGAG